MKANVLMILVLFSLASAALAQRVPDVPSEKSLAEREDPHLPLDTAVNATVTGRTLYGVGLDFGSGSPGSSYLYRIENYSTNPRAQIIGDTLEDLFDVAIDPTTGRFYGLGPDGDLYELSTATGQASRVGFTGRFDLNALAFDATGQAWAWSGASGDLFQVDKEVGLATRVGATGFDSGGDLAFDTNGALYGTTDDRLIRINKNTGSGTLVGALGVSGAYGLEIDSDGTMYMGRGDIDSGLAQLYRVNKSTGAATLIGSISGGGNYGLSGLAFAGAPSGSSLYLRNGRFKVEASWRLPNGSVGAGNPALLTADTGYFWFFDANNVEFFVKILDGCGLNNRFWVFLGGLTDLRVDIRVTDTVRGTTKTYTNLQGKAFQPIQDTSAFATCP